VVVPARENPFRSECVERLRFRLSEGEWSHLLARLVASQFRGAIVGSKGAGKTTLLIELAARLTDRGFKTDILLADAAGAVTSAEFAAMFSRARACSEMLLLDGADRLGGRQWRRLLNALPGGAGIVITLHQPDWLPMLHECRTSAWLLADLVRELLGPAASPTSLTADRGWPPTDGHLASLLARCQGNIRSALRELYDSWSVGRPPLPSPAETA
jgi:hypothetical protein